MFLRLCRRRMFSAWVAEQAQQQTTSKKALEIEKLFSHAKVQETLPTLNQTVAKTVLTPGITEQEEKTQFQLMSDEELKHVRKIVLEILNVPGSSVA